MAATPFVLSVTVTDSRLVVRSGMYLAPVRTWERMLGLTAGQLLARWDDVYAWVPPDERDAGMCGFEELDEYRAEFVGLPHAAQAAMVAEWEGEPWPGEPIHLAVALRDLVEGLVEAVDTSPEGDAA